MPHTMVDPESIPGPFLTTDAAGSVQGVNAAASALLGRAPADVMGRPFSELFRREHVDAIASAFRDRQSLDLEVGLDGAPVGGRTVLVRSSPLREGPAELAGWHVLLLDLSVQKSCERDARHMSSLYALLSHVNQAVVRSHTQAEVFERVCRGAVELGGLATAWIGLVDPASSEVRIAAKYGEHLEVLSRLAIALNDPTRNCGPTGSAIREGRHVVINDIEGDVSTATWRALAHETGTSSAGAFPIRIHGQPMGALVLYARERNFFGPREILLLEEAASDVSFALSTMENDARRRDAEIVLRSQTAKFSSLFKAVPVGIFVVANRIFIEMNDAACAMTGYTREQLIGSSTRMIYPTTQEFETVGATVYKQIIEKGQASGETRWSRQDGDIIEVQLHAAMIVPGNASAGVTFAAVDVTERRRSERALLQKQAEIEAVYEHAPVMLALVDRAGRFRRVNREFIENTDHGCHGDCARICHSFGCHGCQSGACTNLSNPACEIHLAVNHCLQTGEALRRREWSRRVLRDGRSVDKTLIYSMARVVVGGETLVLLCLADVSEQKSLEAQFRQIQKMEAIGLLAGGIAHDFNNILTASMLTLEDLKLSESLSPSATESIEEIESLSKRAVDLTRQLLLFSRRKSPQTRSLDLNGMVERFIKMLTRMLGESITVSFTPTRGAAIIVADPGMIEQVVMNLCVNARDAMPRGGRLDIAVTPRYFTESEAQERPQARAGSFACLSITDTGCGMNAETLSHIFEPFFTTKDVGKGTGLGLATVFGIVQQHQGWVDVSSTVGEGTTFFVYFPLDPSGAGGAKETSDKRTTGRRGSETILLVEDEAAVRTSIARLLRGNGYTILEAEDPVAARQHWDRAPHSIDLLLTDMVMPGAMTGLALARSLRGERPSLEVIVVSGYSADLLTIDPAAENIIFLSKPISLAQLNESIRTCLDGRKGREEERLKAES